MKFNLEYKNGCEPFEVATKKVPGWNEPIMSVEIEGNGGRAKKEALTDILLHIECAFRDLLNMHDTDIQSFKISDSDFLVHLSVSNDEVELDETKNIFDMIIFSFYSDVFAEKLLFTCDNDTSAKRKKGALKFENHFVNEKLLSSNTRVKDENFLNSLLVVIKTYLPDYDLKINPKTKKFEYFYKGSVLNDIEEIKDDDVFLFFKFVELLLTKNDHFGIFFIDTSVLRLNVLTALLGLINLVYLNKRYVFLYNVNSKYKKELKNLGAQSLVFKNHKIPLKK